MFDVADNHVAESLLVRLLLLLFVRFSFQIDQPLQRVTVLAGNPSDLPLQILVAPVTALGLATALGFQLFQGLLENLIGNRAGRDNKIGELKAFSPHIVMLTHNRPPHLTAGRRWQGSPKWPQLPLMAAQSKPGPGAAAKSLPQETEIECMLFGRVRRKFRPDVFFSRF